MSENESIVAFAAIAGSLVIGLVSIVSHVRKEARKRELEHLERMRALELGRVLPKDESWLSPTRIGALICMVGPIATFLCATLATAAAGFQREVWVAVAMVATASVITGSIIVMQAQGCKKPDHSSDYGKPYVEEDAYDVASSRG